MTKLTDSVVRSLLQGKWPELTEKKISHGIQFALPEGTVVNFFPSTSKTLVQGKAGSEKAECEELLGLVGSSAAAVTAGSGAAADVPQSNRVFIVYGHDTNAREQLELLLRRLKLEPVILANLPSKGQTIIEKLEEHRKDVRYACALLTPDDEGHRRDQAAERRYRARQNVVLELGMFLAMLGRKRVAILHKGDIDLPSDIHGLVYISFKDHVNEVRQALAAELQEAGFRINIKDLLAT